jgi:hypothetical protein
MATTLKTNPDDPKFINAVKNLNEGDTLEVADGTLVVEGKFTKPTHFLFHQRIFPAGIVLHKLNSNTRIYIEAEKLGMKADKVQPGEFDDRQIEKGTGKVLAPDRGRPSVK